MQGEKAADITIDKGHGRPATMPSCSDVVG